MTARDNSEGLQGELPEPGRCRIEDPDNPDAWIEATHRDGWVQRKLMTEDKTAYMEMVEPFYQRCCHCREYHSVEMWAWESPYCPSCEGWWDSALSDIISWMFDGEQPEYLIDEI